VGRSPANEDIEKKINRIVAHYVSGSYKFVEGIVPPEEPYSFLKKIEGRQDLPSFIEVTGEMTNKTPCQIPLHLHNGIVTLLFFLE
jgi:hypothetical protein